MSKQYVYAAEDRLRASSAIELMLWIHFGLSLFILACTVGYLPERPPEAPSVSAGLGRQEFVRGLKELLPNWSFWCLVLSISLTWAIFSNWSSLLNTILRPLGVTQDTTSDIGTYSNILTAVASFVAGLCAPPTTAIALASLHICYL